MTKPVYVVAIGFFLLMGLAAPACGADDLAARDWSVKAKSPLDKNPPAPEDVRAFVNKILKADMNPALCSFKFLDIAKDGVYRLAVSLDASGRHLCNELVVIGKKDSGFAVINHWKVW